MIVLVDTSVWVDYFRDAGRAGAVDELITENLAATNELILCEIVPPLALRNERGLIRLLGQLKQCPLTIDWHGIRQMQIACLRHGINKVGIPDLIIAQNAIQCGATLLSNDRHFGLLSEITSLKVYR